MGSIEALKVICRRANLPEGKLSNEFLFTIDMVDLFFYKRNIGQMDIKSGFVDGAYDGGIDFVYQDGETMYLIQGKSSEKLSIEDIKNVFYKMADTVQDFEENNNDKYSKELNQAYINAYDSLNDDKNIELVLFTNTELNPELNTKIIELSKNEKINNFIIKVYGKREIQVQETILYQNSDLISEDSIDIYLNKENTNNMLSYGEEGIIVNVKASSIKNLYLKYKESGLFSYNLREYITQKSVDDGIDDTIKKEKDNFWFYNNGITIGCNDFRKDGNKIKLYDFSIINGAQTTTKIGKSKYVNNKNDFAVVCKIVRAKNSVEEDKDFISKISEASNSQKPIKQRDLKSNAIEQKILQKECANNGKYSLAVEIKRGIKPQNYKKVEKWQRVTNEYIGQLLYACVFQKPGPARSCKNVIFSSNRLYKQLFLRKHDYNTIYDLVKISNEYDEYASNSTDTNDLDKIAAIKNGKLTILAVSIYLCKKKRGILYNSYSDELHKDNLDGFLISEYSEDDLSDKLKQLFDFIVRQLQFIYKMKREEMKITSYSNFFKLEQIYDIILKTFDELDSWDQEKLDSYLKIFTESNENKK